MIFTLDARQPRDIYDSYILVFGELEEIWRLWFILEKDYIIMIHNSSQSRVNPLKGGHMPEMMNKDVESFDRQQFEKFDLPYEKI
jgi:hypothetical protein